jgi:uncharacterized protein
MKYLSVPFEKDDLQETGVIRGYGSTFGGRPDSYGDVIAHGAFSESILKNGRGGLGIAMLYQHDASRPVGIWNTIHEDGRGLRMEGQLAMKTQLGAETYELLKMDALKGLSIGFDLPRDKNGEPDKSAFEIDEKSKTRTLKRINLWEVSLVTFPANTRARVTGIKALEDAANEREFERALRESGLTRSEALYVTKLCRSSLRDSGDGINEILHSLREINVSKGPVDRVIEALQSVNNQLKIA